MSLVVQANMWLSYNEGEHDFAKSVVTPGRPLVNPGAQLSLRESWQVHYDQNHGFMCVYSGR